MAVTNITQILEWFKTGKKPTQSQFWATWASFWHKHEGVVIKHPTEDELLMGTLTVLTNQGDVKIPKSGEYAGTMEDLLAEVARVGIIAKGTITRSSNDFTFSIGFVWKILAIQYQNSAAIVRTIANATAGYYRIDIAVLDVNNDIVLIAGVEDDTAAEMPAVPTGTIFLTSWSIFGAEISEPSEPVVGDAFIKKAELIEQAVYGTGARTLFLGSESTSFIIKSDDITEISGCEVDDDYDTDFGYSGKILRIKNETISAKTIKHSSAAWGFRFPNNENFILGQNEVLTLRQTKTSGVVHFDFISIGRISNSSTQNLQTVTNGVGNNITSNPIIIGDYDMGNYIEISEQGVLIVSGHVYVARLSSGSALEIVNGFENLSIEPAYIFKDGEYYHFPTGVSSPLATLADIPIINEHFKGKYSTLLALETAHPTANPGDYGQVDAGSGSDVVNYNWDDEEGWVKGSSGSGATDTDALPEGAANLYFTNARALAAVPDASPTTKGKLKLYNDLLASNTDGGVTQAALVAKFGLVDNQLDNFLRDKTGIKRSFEIAPNSTYEPSGWVSSNFVTQGTYQKSGEVGVGFKTTATAGDLAFKRRAAALNMKGNTGIFWEKIKFDSAVTDARFFHCLTPDFFFSAPTNVSPTTLLNVVGVCKLSTSQNIHVFHNDASGVATTIDLGASFPANNVGGDKLYLIGLEAKTSSYVVHVHQLDLSTWELNGTSVVTEVSTDIPNRLTSDLRLTTFITNNTTASIASYVDYHILATNIK